jgi:2-polyprenyl-3-methyl-5-hydroxy-6-metoxy-1,4-benzoquinol methylase
MLTRQREYELMDDPMLDRKEHAAALAGLARLNAASGSARAVWRPVRRLYQELFVTKTSHVGRPRPIKILDIACGSGDVPIELCKIAGEAGIAIEVDGCDISATAVEECSQRAKRTGSGMKTRFFQLDALKEPLPTGYDVVVSSLFMHHLEEQEAVALMRKMGEAAGELVVVNDLVRSQMSLMLVTFACHTLTSSRVVQFDGPASVRSAFTPLELRYMASAAGLHNSTIRERFPCRMLLSWRKSGSD